MQSIAFMHFSLALTLLLALNFGLCFGMGVLAYPMALAVDKNISKIRQRILLLVSNPFIAIFFMYSFTQDRWSWNLFNVMVSSWDNMSCWTWPVVSCSWLTSWILIVLSCNGEQESVNKEPKSIKQEQLIYEISYKTMTFCITLIKSDIQFRSYQSCCYNRIYVPIYVISNRAKKKKQQAHGD